MLVGDGQVRSCDAKFPSQLPSLTLEHKDRAPWVEQTSSMSARPSYYIER